MSVRTLEMPVATLRYALCAFCETPVVDVFSASTPIVRVLVFPPGLHRSLALQSVFVRGRADAAVGRTRRCFPPRSPRRSGYF